MKGEPEVLWTCDRCRTTEWAPWQGSPAQWWLHSRRPAGLLVAENVESQMCDECDSALVSAQCGEAIGEVPA